MEDQGIMALPTEGMQAPTAQPVAPTMDPAAEAAFEQARTQINPKEFGDSLLEEARKADPEVVDEFVRTLQQINLPPEVIDAMQQMVEIILRDPENYDSIRSQMIADGVPQEILPPTFDPEYFSILRLALDRLGSMAPAAEMPVAEFADGGIANLRPIASALQNMGRGQDTMLAHITPQEARILQMQGGIGTINPQTGLREFGFFSSIGKAFKSVGKAISGAVKGIVNGVKKFAQSSVGRIVTAVALGFFLGPAAASMLTVSSAAGVAAVSGFVGGFGSTLLAGGSFKDALKTGAIGGVTAGVIGGVSQGFNTAYTGPTTVSGQWDSFTNSLKSLGTTGPGTAAQGPSSNLADLATEATTTPASVTANAPNVPMTPDGAIMYPGQQANLPASVDMAAARGPATTMTDVRGGIGNLPQADQFVGPPEPSFLQKATGQAGGLTQDVMKGATNFFSPPANTAAQQQLASQYGLQVTDPTASNYAFVEKGVSPKLQEAIIKAGQPTFGTTSRVIGTGLAGLALTGGFSPEPREELDIAPTETGTDLLRQYPDVYGVKVGGARVTYGLPAIRRYAEGGAVSTAKGEYKGDYPLTAQLSTVKGGKARQAFIAENRAGLDKEKALKAARAKFGGYDTKIEQLQATAASKTAKEESIKLLTNLQKSNYSGITKTPAEAAAGKMINQAYTSFVQNFYDPRIQTFDTSNKGGLGVLIEDQRPDETALQYDRRYWTEMQKLLTLPEMYVADPNYVEPEVELPGGKITTDTGELYDENVIVPSTGITSYTQTPYVPRTVEATSISTGGAGTPTTDTTATSPFVNFSTPTANMPSQMLTAPSVTAPAAGTNVYAPAFGGVDVVPETPSYAMTDYAPSMYQPGQFEWASPAYNFSTNLAGLSGFGGFATEPMETPNYANLYSDREAPASMGDVSYWGNSVLPPEQQPDQSFGQPVGTLNTLNAQQYPTFNFAKGGIAAVAPRRYNMGGYAGGGKPQHFPRRTGQISGPGTETSDDIPAMLSDGEFVMTARAVRGAGGGSRREGAKRMYQMMRAFERKA